MSNIYSNAYNFSEYISSGVDPRTGSFSMQINLGNFISEGGAGFTFPLTISYDPSNPIDSGFGRGWSLPLSEFNKNNNSLKLSTGQSFQIQWNSEIEEYDIPYRKLKDIRVFYISESEEIKVVFKGGKEEYIDYNSGVIKKIVSSQGIEINFEFYLYFGRKRLWRIYDNMRSFQIDSPTEFETIITQKQSDLIFLVSRLNRQQNNLNAFSIDGFTEYLSLKYISFNDIGYSAISEVIHPSGLKENISYLHSQQLPTGAPIDYIPCVHLYTRNSGEGEGNQEVTYSFSDHNYLGFGSDRTWSSDSDTLFDSAQDYQYTSTEVINGIKKIVRTYNKYHLMIKVNHYNNNLLFQSAENNYYANTSLTINDQVAQYSLLKSQTTVNFYNGNSKSRTISYEYDEYANQIKKINADGSIITREYYPVQGIPGYCPSEPNGMVSIIKSEKLTPPPQYNDVSRVILYTYISLPKINGGNAYFIVLNEEKHNNLKSVCDYYNNVMNPIFHGRIKKINCYVNEIWTTQTKFYYENFITYLEIVQEDHIIDDNENVIIRTSSKTDYKYNLVIEAQDHDGIIEKTIYDNLGRVIEKILLYGTPSSFSLKTEYNVSPNNNWVIETDGRGNKEKSIFNNAGKQLSLSIKLFNSHSFMIVERFEYNNFGLLKKQTNTDWLNGSVYFNIYALFEYDQVGNVNKITHGDARVEKIEQNPVNLSTVYTIEGISKVTTYYNESGLEIKKTTYSNDNVLLATSTNVYDGYGNIIEIRDTIGNKINTSYDQFDRVSRVIRNIDGFDIVESFTYPEFTDKEFVSEINVNNKVMGNRVYDKLLRIKREVISGIETNFTYDNISSRILTIKKPGSDTVQNVITFIYDPILKMPLSRTTTPQQYIDAAFTYDDETGDLLRTLNPQSDNNYLYDSLGRMTQETMRLNTGQLKTAQTEYTLQGKLNFSTDVQGNTRNIRYDQFGRPDLITEIIAEETISTLITYDNFSRANNYKVTAGENSSEILLTFNAIGAEISRFAYFNDIEVFNITQEFNQSMLLNKRIFIRNGLTTTETFEYDDLYRLTLFQCNGENCPLDNEGNTIVRQTYTHDIYGNVSQVNSVFKNNESNIRTFTYMENYPAILYKVENTHSSYTPILTCQYDTSGNLINDEEGREYLYDVLGKIVRVNNNDSISSFLTSYSYNANGQMIAQKGTDNEFTYFYYLHNKLNNEISFNAEAHHSYRSPGLSFRQVNINTEKSQQFLIGNGQKSTLQTFYIDNHGTKTEKKYTYTPFGEQNKTNDEVA